MRLQMHSVTPSKTIKIEKNKNISNNWYTSSAQWWDGQHENEPVFLPNHYKSIETRLTNSENHAKPWRGVQQANTRLPPESSTPMQTLRKTSGIHKKHKVFRMQLDADLTRKCMNVLNEIQICLWCAFDAICDSGEDSFILGVCHSMTFVVCNWFQKMSMTWEGRVPIFILGTPSSFSIRKVSSFFVI